MNTKEWEDLFVELFMMTFPAKKDVVFIENIAGAQVNYSICKGPITNRVSFPPVANAAFSKNVFLEVKQFFAARQSGFCFVVFDRDLASVEQMDLHCQNLGCFLGMTAGYLSVPVKADPQIKIKRAQKEDLEIFSELEQKGYGMPKAESDFMAEHFYLAEFPELKIESYIAYVEDKPVGWGSSVLFPKNKFVCLGGAGVLPEYRGRGLYKRLVNTRMESAKEQGYERFIIQAKDDTSAPLCQKIGFKEVCRQHLLIWAGAS